jgi:agmatinase
MGTTRGDNADKVRAFDPNQPGTPETLWGLPFDVDDAALVIVPVPWEVTVSYGAGTADAPAAVLTASIQVDLVNDAYPDAWKRGIAMAPAPDDVRSLNHAARPHALKVIGAIERGTLENARASLAEVNRACEEMVTRVRSQASALLEGGKRVGVLGGDHSVPLGLMQALAERYDDFGILHIDAHCDLRHAYEGFDYSHASIMRNAIELSSLSKLVQVGVRDYCEEELAVIRDSNGKIRLFTDRSLARRSFSGETWATMAEEIIEALPENVYVSFDVDGLDPSLCPGTGTPVPGGLGFEQALYLVERLSATERNIIGFDLSEVSPAGERGSEWDANVGARVLYRLSCAALAR